MDQADVSTERSTILRPLYATAFMSVAAAIVLWFQGRVWWCMAGDPLPWSFDIWSTHNSQHLIDPYSFTHALHGVLEFWLLGLFFARLSLSWRYIIAIAVESVWEVVENSSYIIERYREETISLNYFGDSIPNSLADIAFCAAGFLVAYKLRFWKSLVLFLVTEAVLIVWIRDSFLINIVMLLCPLDAIRRWQMGG